MEERKTRKQREEDDNEEKEMAGVRGGGGGVKDEDEEEGEEDEDSVLREAEDSFFNSMDRVPSGVSLEFDALSSDSSSDEEDDPRFSFASAVGPPSFRRISISIRDGDVEQLIDNNNNGQEVGGDGEAENFDYGIWMAEPISIKERRRRLLQGMGLTSSRDLPTGSKNRRIPSCRSRAPSTRFTSTGTATAVGGPTSSLPPLPTKPLPAKPDPEPEPEPQPEPQPQPQTLPQPPTITRRRSDSQLLEMRHPAVGPTLFRSSSAPPSFGRAAGEGRIVRGRGGDIHISSGEGDIIPLDDICKIKNLDTGKEFVVSEYQKDGSVCRLNEVQTGIQFTMEEFEKFLGHSPIVKELMRRIGGGDKKKTTDDNGNDENTAKSADANCRAIISKNASPKPSSGGGGNGRKKASWLKNIKFVASSVTGLISDKERDHHHNSNHTSNSSERLKVHQHGKSHRELTGLYMCQEIQAHQGSIWTIKFSTNSRYLASAGEDHVVHVWEVVECDILSSSLLRQDQTQSSPVPQIPLPNGSASMNRSNQPCKKTKKGRTSSAKRRNSLPDYIVMPETVFSLTQTPVCSFEGHLDDVLDLSWSKSQYLLSSSMDKTVRLWDLETKTCLKLFAHNDYVTCIQFNPIDDQYFISGSLDAKVRIWSIPDRRVVDWSDLHEMVTAACYTPDGQGAIVGSHKGSCRLYNTSDCKLNQEGQIDIRNKKKKSNAKKVTGFQFAPDNPSEVLVTSADSQIRVFDGAEVVQKFRGFRNTSSQISASCSLNGKYVVCASEDSHVYIWKRDRACNANAGGKGKGWVTTRSHEHFYCKDVSVAIPWPNGGSNCEPSPSLPTWSRRLTDNSPSNLEDAFPSGRSNNSSPPPMKSGLLDSPSRSGSGIGSSSSLSASASLRSGGGATSSSSSSATSSLSSWGWGGNSNRNGGNLEAASAWGLVVVTAGQGGTIRVYQNFGLPLRLSRQANLF